MSNGSKQFADNLQDLIAESGLTLNQLAKEIGISVGALCNYQNDSTSAGMDAIIKIADYFDVSTDWLLGRSSVRSPSATVQGVCAYTGLSEGAVAYCHNWATLDIEMAPTFLEFLSQLIESKEFDIFLNIMYQCYYAFAAKQILSAIPSDRSKSIQLTLQKLTQGTNYVKSKELRDKLMECAEFLWMSNHNGYALDVPAAYEYHVSQALTELLSAQRSAAQLQAADMLSDTVDNVLQQVDRQALTPEGVAFIDNRFKSSHGRFF